MNFFLIDANAAILNRRVSLAGLWLPPPPGDPPNSPISSYFKRQNIHSADLSHFVHSGKIRKTCCSHPCVLCSGGGEGTPGAAPEELPACCCWLTGWKFRVPGFGWFYSQSKPKLLQMFCNRVVLARQRPARTGPEGWHCTCFKHFNSSLPLHFSWIPIQVLKVLYFCLASGGKDCLAKLPADAGHMSTAPEPYLHC